MKRELDVLAAAERSTRIELRGAVRRVPARLLGSIDVRQPIRRYAWPSVIVAAAVGFTTARALRSSQVRRSLGHATRAAARGAPAFLTQVRSVLRVFDGL